MEHRSDWPPLPLAEWRDTCATLHMWTQIVGKVLLKRAAPLNHWWSSALRVDASGLTTGPMPCGARTVRIDFDFIRHRLCLCTSDGQTSEMALVPRTVADFYQELRGKMRALDCYTPINPLPCEVPDPVRFGEDTTHAAYDPEYASRWWRILLSTQAIFEEFRARFIGKQSPVNFYWGSFDLAVTRFSGRRAPERAGADSITREAYSHEVCSAGFWPGGNGVDEAAFYCYGAPQPAGFSSAPVQPAAAFYHETLGEFLLPYDAVRNADSPREALLEFLQSTYDACARLGDWDRAELERPRETWRTDREAVQAS